MRRSALTLIFLMLPLAASAAPSDELAKTKEAIAASEAQQQKLAGEQANVEKELSELQEKLVKSAAQLQANDAQLEEAQKKLQALERELAEKEKSFASERKRLDGLSRMAIRLSRTPPQAMVLMPTDGKSRIQAARALSLLTAEIKLAADNIQKDMEALNALKIKVSQDKTKAEKIRSANKQEKKAFELALKNRKQLRDKLAASRTQEETKIAALAKKARSLEDLMITLSREEKKPKKAGEKEVVSEEGVTGEQGRLRSFKAAKGRIRIPVSGRVVSAFGDKESSGDGSKGIAISARSGAVVVAPFDAEVAYTGTFLNYGKLVILKHSGDYHTLLAGLGQIDAKVGDFLLEGEPIGVMDSADNKRLYVELRENNQTVNPASWMRGL